MNPKSDNSQEAINKADEERIKDFDFVKSCYSHIEGAPDTPTEYSDARDALYALTNNLYQIARVNGLHWADILRTSKSAMRDLWNMEVSLARREREAKQTEKGR
jgi:hypothetical protein